MIRTKRTEENLRCWLVLFNHLVFTTPTPPSEFFLISIQKKKNKPNDSKISENLHSDILLCMYIIIKVTYLLLYTPVIFQDPELEAIKARVRAMEDEAEKLKQLQTEVDKQLNVPTSPNAASAGPILSFEEKMEIDARSVYVGMKIQKIQMIVSLVPYQNHKLNFFFWS